MSIDGRDIGRPKAETDPFESAGPRILGILLVGVPVLALVVLAYWIGTMTGGFLGGVASVASTALTVLVLWFLARRKRRR